MAPVTNARLLFAQVPKGYPQPGRDTKYDTTQTIDLDTAPLAEGQVLLKTLVVSIDPYIRGRMREADVPSYFPAMTLGEPIENVGVAVVLRSNNPKYKAGDHIYDMLPFQQYTIQNPDLSGLGMLLENKENLPWSVYVGALGLAGQTSYFAWEEYAPKEKGGVAFISTGAGPVGSFVIQLAKKNGMKVIGSAGSEEKVQFMKECGADVAFNYKTTNVNDVLKKEGPINVYWDNVGGETLDAVLANAAKHATIIACGQITVYNDEGGYTYKNMMQLFAKELHIHGFLYITLMPKYIKAFMEEVPGWIARGELKYSEDITNGLEHAGEAILSVQKGTNTGKAVVKVADD